MASILAPAKQAAARSLRGFKKAWQSAWVYACSSGFNTRFRIWHIMLSLTFAVLYFFLNTSNVKLGWVNSLFSSVSMQTNTGLNPVNFKDLGMPVQTLMLLQMELGSFRFISIMLLSKRFRDLKRSRQKQSSTTEPIGTHDVDANGDVELAVLPCGPETPETTPDDGAAGERRQLDNLMYYGTLFLLCLVVFVEIAMLGFAVLIGAFSCRQSEETVKTGLNVRWIGVYTMLSAFQNNGSNLLPSGMASFATDTRMQLWVIVFMLAGNTCWPILLHVVVWLLWLFCRMLGRFSKKWVARAKTLSFLLKNPRETYLFLYPTKQTVWLAMSMFGFSMFDWALFLMASFPMKKEENIPTAQWVLNGLSQSLALRTTGYTIVALAGMPMFYLFLLLVMIYFAIFPTVMTMRSSNPVKHAEEGAGHPTRHWWKYIRAPSRSDRQFLKQLFTEVKAHDNWFMFFSTLTVMVIEMFETKIPDGFVSVLVESISAYSNVGVSMGVPSDGYSFSGSMNWPSRISLCVVMLQGKFRSLPVATDMATVNHSEEAATVEEHDVETGIEAAQNDPDQETYEESTRASWPERVDSMAKQPGSVDIQDIAQEGMIS